MFQTVDPFSQFSKEIVQNLAKPLNIKVLGQNDHPFLFLTFIIQLPAAACKTFFTIRFFFCAKSRQAAPTVRGIIVTVMVMTTVVYGDILFILNAYVTNLLLLLCGTLCREKSRRGRRAAASLLGGLYAFVIFLPRLPRWALMLSRLPAAAVLVHAAFGFGSPKRFLRLFAGFFLVNFVFAGLMGALWHTLHPAQMLYYGTVVYFAIDTGALVALTAVCYALLWGADRVLQSRRAHGCLYDLIVTLGEKSVCCRAFLDTGNDLREPFSGLPVVLLHCSCALQLGVPETPDADRSAALRMRMVPCQTQSGSVLLPAFRPTKLILRSAQGKRETDACYVAVTTRKIKNGEFGALLHPALAEAAEPAAIKNERGTIG